MSAEPMDGAYFGGSSGHSGDTSADGELHRRRRLALILRIVGQHGRDGITSVELERRYGFEHGVVSGALSNLHRLGYIQRLAQRRGGNHGIYVLAEHVDGRETKAVNPNRCADCGRRLRGEES